MSSFIYRGCHLLNSSLHSNNEGYCVCPWMCVHILCEWSSLSTAKPCLDNWKHLVNLLSEWISPGSHNWGGHWVRNASTPSSSPHLHDSYSTFRWTLMCCTMLQNVCQLLFCSDSASLHLKYAVCTEEWLIRSLHCKQQAPWKQTGVLFWAPALTHPGASVMLGTH